MVQYTDKWPECQAAGSTGMNVLRSCAAGIGLMFSIPFGAGCDAQTLEPPVELQLGVQIPTGPLYRDQFTYVRRSTGASMGLMMYSYPQNPLSFRMRGDAALHYLETTEASFADSDVIMEFSIGVDAIPEITRISVRDLEARFYAGFGLRLMVGPGDDVVVLDGSGGPGSTSTWRYAGDGFGVVGRAGWYIRRASKASLLRLDVGYQIGEANTVIQHEIVIRVGIGGY